MGDMPSSIWAVWCRCPGGDLGCHREWQSFPRRRLEGRKWQAGVGLLGSFHPEGPDWWLDRYWDCTWSSPSVCLSPESGWTPGPVHQRGSRVSNSNQMVTKFIMWTIILYKSEFIWIFAPYKNVTFKYKIQFLPLNLFLAACFNPLKPQRV